MGAKPSKSKSYNLPKGEKNAGTSSGSPLQTQHAEKSPTTGAVDGGEEKSGAGTSETDIVERVVCKVSDLKNGEFKDVEVEGRKILLVKDEEKFFAIGSKCTHYAAPLVKGAYCKGFVRCPWHGACFNVKTGDIEDFPGLDSLPVFQTEIVGEEVRVRATRSALSKSKWRKPMAPLAAPEQPPVLIVGGGAAGLSCAETLRQEGYGGRILLLCKEPSLPYDRPKLSKAADVEVEKIYLRPPDFYSEHQIEVKISTAATSVDTGQKVVTAEDGVRLAYDKLVLCTGGEPRRLSCPGAELENVCYLRTPADSRRIYGLCDGKKIVLVGSSFVGMELACHFVGAAHKAASVTVVGESAVPLDRVFGAEVGSRIQRLYESNGVEFRLSSGVGRTAGGFVPVDGRMRTNVPDVYACGDITAFPLSSFADRVVNVQHWQMALKQGKAAGKAVAGKAEPIQTVPFFWTVLFGKSIRYAGYGAGYGETLVRGSLEDLKFVVYYMSSSGNLVAVATLNRDPVAAQIAECFRVGKSISRSDIEQNLTDDWSAMLRSL